MPCISNGQHPFRISIFYYAFLRSPTIIGARRVGILNFRAFETYLFRPKAGAGVRNTGKTKHQVVARLGVVVFPLYQRVSAGILPSLKRGVVRPRQLCDADFYIKHITIRSAGTGSGLTPPPARIYGGRNPTSSRALGRYGDLQHPANLLRKRNPK